MSEKSKEFAINKKEYENNGYTIFRNVIDKDLLKEVDSHINFLSRKFPNLRPEHYHHPLMRDDAFWVRLITDARLLDIAQLFLGSNIANFTSHYVCKPPHDGQAVLWHQDAAYWNLQPMHAISLWLAIDHSGPKNGCLKMIPGTQRLSVKKLKLNEEEPNMLFSTIDDEVDSAAAVNIVLEPGDVSVHNPFIIHGSEANKSNKRRCGLDIGYIQTSTKVANKDLYLYPILARGVKEEGINMYRSYPEYDIERTISFKGCEHWNEYIKTKNESSIKDQDYSDVMVITQRMMQRLKEGNTAL